MGGLFAGTWLLLFLKIVGGIYEDGQYGIFKQPRYKLVNLGRVCAEGGYEES